MDPNTQYTFVSVDNGTDPQNGTSAGVEAVRVVTTALRASVLTLCFVVLGHSVHRRRCHGRACLFPERRRGRVQR